MNDIEKIRSFTHDVIETLKKIKNGEEFLLDEEQSAARLEICKSCEFFTKTNRCIKCGCFMLKKVQIKVSSCPIGKWTKQQ